jgi:hypothetical protein
MRRNIARINCIVFGLLLAGPASSWAQGRTPSAGSAAVGGEGGIFIARDESFGSGPTLEGFYEYYFQARNSVRFGMGWANPSFDREDEDSMRNLRVAVDIVHNWEGGAIHPFVGGGAAIYFLQEKDNGRSIGDSRTQFGGTFFGGLEYFTGRTFAIKGEARYHAITDVGAFDPDGLSLTIGVKKYF